MEEQQAAVQEVKPMSFMEKLTDVFASPGELFENVRLTGKTNSNWLVPMLLLIAAAILSGQLMIHNASLSAQLGELTRKSFDKQTEKAIQEGKLTKEQADQQYEQFAKPGSTIFTISQIGGTVIVIPIVLFAVSLVYWLMGKSVMKATAPYMKVVEVVGLTFFIGALEYIITTLMMVATDSIHATPGLGVFVSNFDVENKLHLALSKVNLFTFWSLGVTGIGLAKLFQRDFAKVLVLVVALWILWTLGTILLGIGFMG